MLTDKVITRPGFRLIIKSGTVSKLIQQQIIEGLNEIAKSFKDQVDKNVSLDDHSVQELRELGYPYAVGKPENVPHDDRLVHEQSGRLRESIRTAAAVQTSSRTFETFVKTNDPAAAFLIYGTSKMRPRRFHEKAFNDLKEKYWEPLTKRLKGLNYRMEVTKGKL